MSDDRENLKLESSPTIGSKPISGKDLSDEELVPEELGLSPAWRQELLRRIRDYHQNPELAIPWEEVVSMVEQKVLGAR